MKVTSELVSICEGEQEGKGMLYRVCHQGIVRDRHEFKVLLSDKNPHERFDRNYYKYIVYDLMGGYRPLQVKASGKER